MQKVLNVACPHCQAINSASSEPVVGGQLCAQCHKEIFDGEVLELTTEMFVQHIVNSDLPVLVDFWAPWCGPCRMMTPVVHTIAKELAMTVRVAKINTETEGALANRFNIRSIPTLMLFQSDKVIAQRMGATDARSLLKWVEESLG